MIDGLNRQKANDLLGMVKAKKAPVDVEKIAEELGFLVVPYPFGDKSRGLLHIDPENGDKIIGVNETHSKVMQRFTIAHEIGHYLNGHQHYEKTFIDDNSRFFDPHFRQEKEADLFASELLMPKKWLEGDIQKNGLDAKVLASKYEVSEQAMWIRLTSLKLVQKYS